MMLTLQREHSREGRTFGRVSIGETFFSHSLEDEIREVPGVPVSTWKIPGQTAIPAGTYRITLIFSPHFQRKVPLLHDVEGFDAIEIHPGTTIGDTRGCLLLGFWRTPTGLLQSRFACDAITDRLSQDPSPSWITIRNPVPPPLEIV